MRMSNLAALKSEVFTTKNIKNTKKCRFKNAFPGDFECRQSNRIDGKGVTFTHCGLPDTSYDRDRVLPKLNAYRLK